MTLRVSGVQPPQEIVAEEKKEANHDLLYLEIAVAVVIAALLGINVWRNRRP